MIDEETLSLFDIDRERLVEEFSKHPRIYGEHALKLAEARKTLGECEATLEVIQAELSLNMRRNPEKYDIPKITEEVVKAYVVSHKRYRSAHDEVIRAKSVVNMLQATVNTLDQRKNCIEGLLKLLMGEFYSMPKVPNETQARLSNGRPPRSRCD